MRLLVLSVAVALLLTGGAAAGEAGPRVSPVLGSDFRISSSTDWEERTAVVWNDTAEEYLVVWSDFRAASGLSDIYGRRVRPDGTPVGTADFRISGPGAVSDETYPAVAWNATADQYLVIWIDWRNGSYADIYGRRLKGDGTALGADFRVSVSAPKDEGLPDVVWNATKNQYLVVWSDTRASKTDIYGQRVGANGGLVGAEIRISGAGATNDEYNAAVAWNATSNQYLVVWEDLRSVTKWHIYGRRINANGGPIGEDFRISGDAGSYSETRPDAAWNSATNQFLVVWEDYRGDNHLADLYGRRVRANGTVVGDADVKLSSAAADSHELRPALAWNGTSNQFLLVWEDQRDGAERDWDIFGRKVRSNGLPTGADFRICGPGAVDQDLAPALAWNGANDQYLVVWEDDRNPAGNIYGRLVAG
jgi:hypothetical protein